MIRYKNAGKFGSTYSNLEVRGLVDSSGPFISMTMRHIDGHIINIELRSDQVQHLWNALTPWLAANAPCKETLIEGNSL